MIKGSKMSEESKIKIRQSLIGNKRRLGIKHRDDVKLRISKSHKGVPLSESHRKKIGIGNTRRIYSKETRLKLAKHMYGNNYNKGKKVPYEKKILHMGVNHHNWRGGPNSILKAVRSLYEYRQWRSDIFQRDDYTCQICGIKGYKLNADHIKAFSLIIKENNIKTIQEALDCPELWNLNNGRTLCFSCHTKTDNWGYRVFNKKQLSTACTKKISDI